LRRKENNPYMNIPVKSRIVDYLLKTLSMSSIELMYSGELVRSDDTPTTLKMRADRIEEISIYEVSASYPPQTVHEREVKLLVMGDARVHSTDIVLMRVHVEMNIEVGPLKDKLAHLLPFLSCDDPQDTPRKRDAFFNNDIWALVYNRTILDDQDTLKGAGVKGCTKSEYIGLVNMAKMHSSEYGRHADRQLDPQTEIVVQTQTYWRDNFLTVKRDLRRNPDFVRLSLDTPIYIGPPRHSQITLPVVKLVGGFTKTTTVGDLVHFYKDKSTFLVLSNLRFNNRNLAPEELVWDVLKYGSTGKYVMVDHYYFTFLETFAHPSEEEDSRSIDDLVRDVEGTKGAGKKRNNVKKTENKKKKKSKNLNVNVNVSAPECLKDTEPANALDTRVNEEEKVIKEIEAQIEEMSVDITHALNMIEDVVKENAEDKNKIEQMDQKLSEFAILIENVKREKSDAIERVEVNNEVIKGLYREKLRLRKSIEEGKLIKTKLIENIESKKVICREIIDKTTALLDVPKQKEKPKSDPRKQLLDFLIQKKEKELECPVCLVPATVPIYSCPESHLICFSCRPKVAECPECRVVYSDKGMYKRHRYAERMVEELDMFRKELENELLLMH